MLFRSDGMDYGAVEKILKECCKYHKEKSRTIKNHEAELIIEVRASDREELLRRLGAMDKLTQVNCIAHDGECRI